MKKFYLLLYFLFILSTTFAQTFSGATGPITDDGQPNEYVVSVNGAQFSNLNTSLGLTQVCLNITHTWNSDLNVFLVSPNGTMVNLFSGIGGDGDNFTNTCLNQSAPTSINTGSSPFTGTFKPQETLGNFNNGQNGNGVWKLRIIDTYAFADTGSVLSWSITFGSNAPTPFAFTSSNLPIVIINTNGVQIQDEPSINATMGIIYNGVGATNLVTDAPNDYNGNILIEYRGNYSQSLPQKPYKIETIDAANAELDVSLLGMPAEHDWLLIANYNDKVFMRNTLAYNLFTNMGHYATRHQYCEVVVNGSYQGIYILMESIKRDNNRVDIAKLDPDENSGLDLTGGYILKNDLSNSNDSWLLNFNPIDHPDLDIRLIYEYPKPETISLQQKTYIQSFINDYETALYSSNFSSPTSGYRNFIDTNSFIDYFIVNELSRNNDGFKKSVFFHKGKNTATAIGKLKAGPVWDFDWAWKNINECSIFSATDGSGWAHLVNNCNPDNYSTGWHVRLLQDTSFQNELRCRWNELRTTILSETALFNYIDTNALYLNQAQIRHFDRWGNLGLNTGAPEVDPDPNTFAGQITKFKNWISLRLDWLDENIPGNPAACSLSTSENTSNTLQLYPNPADDYFFIQSSDWTANTTAKIRIIDLFGRTIHQNTMENSNESITISNYQSGTYFVEVLTDTSKFMTKLIIQ
jgi:subtilisin-like proprotein convertase family protein